MYALMIHNELIKDKIGCRKKNLGNMCVAWIPDAPVIE